MNLEDVAARFPGGRWSNGQYRALCPAHPDVKPSLGIGRGEKGGIVLRCGAGCATKDVLAAVGLSLKDLAPPGTNGHGPAASVQYRYEDAAGKLIATKHRKPGKAFVWQQASGDWNLKGVDVPLFGVPELLRTEPGGLVLIVEGEKDVLTARRLGFAATTNPDGAGKEGQSSKWKPAYTKWLAENLAGRQFCVIPDNDTAGRAHAAAVLSSLARAGLNARLLALDGLPEKGDLTDWAEQGHSAAELQTLIDSALQAPPLRPAKMPEPNAGRVLIDEDAAGDDLKPPQDYDLAEAWSAANRGRFCFREGDEWAEFDGSKWDGVSASTVEGSIQVWLRDRTGVPVNITAPRREAIRKLSQVILTESRDGRPMRREWFDQDLGMIPFRNGMLCLQSGRMFAHSPRHYSTRCLPYAFDPGADCPRFKAFLKQSMIHRDGSPYPEWADLLGEWLGYNLIADTRAQRVLVNCGPGGNGKGVWAEILERLVGGDQCYTISPKALTDNPGYQFAYLFGKTAAFINDPDPKELLDCWGPIKILSGQDTVDGRPPYGRVPCHFKPQARLVISCNEVPETRNVNRALLRRLLFVEWRHEPGCVDTGLVDKLAAELPGIANLALRGLARLAAREWHFEETDESLDLKEAYRRNQDVAERWLDDNWVADKEAFTPIEDLYQDFAAWCPRSGERPITKAKLSKRLGELGHGTEKRKILGAKRNGRRLRRRRAEDDEGE